VRVVEGLLFCGLQQVSAVSVGVDAFEFVGGRVGVGCVGVGVGCWGGVAC